MSILKIKQEDFTLNKVKVLKDSVVVEFQSRRELKGHIFIDQHVIECKELPHPDMKEALKPFKKPLAECVNAMTGVNVLMGKKLIVDPNIKKKALKEYREDIESEILETIDVKSIHFKETNGIQAFIIGGGFNSSLGWSGISTPKITLRGEDDRQGVDEDVLSEALDNLKHEVFQYAIKGKRAFLTLFDKTEEENNTPEEEKKVA